MSDPAVIVLRNVQTLVVAQPGPQGPPGPPGGDAASGGWTPILAVATDGERRVLQVADWTGGTGTKPSVGQFIGVSGLVGTAASGVDIRGAQGASGGGGAGDGNDGWSPVLAIVSDGARRVLRVTDWTGGEGTKPATGSYVGPTGLVATAAEAVDIRGAAGTDGAAGATGAQGPQGPAGAAGATGPQGPAGADGSAGAAGAAGAPGSVWFSASGAPSTGTGIVGDRYLNTANGDHYEKTGASSWTLRGNLTGPTGATGATGAAGATGATGPEGPAGADGAGATPFDRSVCTVVEDFVNGASGTHGWTARTIGTGATSTHTTGDSSHPGIFQIRTGTSTPAGISVECTSGSSINQFTISGNAFEVQFIFRFVTSLASARLRIGLLDGSTVTPTNGMGIRYDVNATYADTTFKLWCRAASSDTVTDTGVTPVLNTWYRARIWSTGDGVIRCSFNGGSEITISSGVPTVALHPGAILVNDTAADNRLDLDWYVIQATGLTR